MTRHTQKKAREQCQCSSSCKNPPINNASFCTKHIKFCPRLSPMTGYEPKFDPEVYNKHKGMKESLNCFAYAFDYQHLPKRHGCTKNACSLPFPQPGRSSGYPKWSKIHGKRCPDIISRLFGDVPDLKMTTFEGRCPKKYSKIALVVDEDEDYHFYRQDSNGYWSHKPGGTDVTNIDATGRPIYNPELASRLYPNSGLNYDQFCGYLCAPRRKTLHFKRGGKRSTSKRSTSKRSTSKRNTKRAKKQLVFV
jgi:hypothetical protein